MSEATTTLHSLMVIFFKQKTAYEIASGDWSSDVCSSDLGDVPYTYEVVPTGFAEDRWVQMSDVLPSLRSNVHHAVVYIRPPDSAWLRHAPVGVPFSASTLRDPDDRRGAHWTDSDILL